MDELYHARLSAHPHEPPQPEHPSTFPLPHPNVVPVPLPNIYLNTYPPLGPSIPASPPKNTPTKPAPAKSGMRVGPWNFTRPHPLLWISLILSIIALVLGVPKGALPTLTGRHKALRAREKIVDEKLNLISHLSHFLPPPLASLVQGNKQKSKNWALSDTAYSHGGLRFWTSGQIQRGEEGRWWSVEELGEGASVVRSSQSGSGAEKEVWVLRMGEKGDTSRPLLSALTHSLLLRDRLQQDLDDARSRASSQLISTSTPALSQGLKHLAMGHVDVSGHQQVFDADEWDRLEARKKRDQEREKEVEQREKSVGEREKWVIEEIRKMSDKIHYQANELTLEDRITERLKSYQRQLSQLKVGEQDKEGIKGDKQEI